MLAELALTVLISVVSVADGDTIRVKPMNSPNSISYRLVGYDTPELFSPKCPEERALAVKARARLIELIKDPTSKMEEVKCDGPNFGRKCGILYVNDVNVGNTLVAEGLADEYYCDSGGCPRRKPWCARLKAKGQDVPNTPTTGKVQ